MRPSFISMTAGSKVGTSVKINRHAPCVSFMGRTQLCQAVQLLQWQGMTFSNTER